MPGTTRSSCYRCSGSRIRILAIEPTSITLAADYCRPLALQHLLVECRDRHLADDVVLPRLVAEIDDLTLLLERQDGRRGGGTVPLRRQFPRVDTQVVQILERDLDLLDVITHHALQDVS